MCVSPQCTIDITTGYKFRPRCVRRTHFEQYLPGADIGDANYLFGTQQGQILEQVLKQCGDDLSRENILKQARAAFADCRF